MRKPYREPENHTDTADRGRGHVARIGPPSLPEVVRCSSLSRNLRLRWWSGGSALRVAAPRSLLGIVDQVQFAW